MTTFPIGELSKKSHVKVPTIRYYESIGLMPKPIRTKSNRRLYSEAALRQLTFIRRGRELGFELEAIRQLQDLLLEPKQPCEGAHVIATQHLEDIEDKITQLLELKDKIQTMLKCDHLHHVENCTILETLGGDI